MGLTALHMASLNGHLEIVRLLLELGKIFFVHFQKLFPMANAVWKFHTISCYFLRGNCYKLRDGIKNCIPSLLLAWREGGKGGVCYINCGTTKILYNYSSGRVKGRGKRGCLLWKWKKKWSNLLLRIIFFQFE